MDKTSQETPQFFDTHTKFFFSFFKLLESPLGSLFYIFAFILYKDLNATPLHLTVLISSKPAVALLSIYGNIFIKDRASNLKVMIALFIVLGSLPCFFFPFVDNIWFFIFAHGIFMLSLRAVLPAWSEILKLNLPSDSRSKAFSRGSITTYATNIAIPLIVSPLLDTYPHLWRWLFVAFAALNCLNVLLLFKLKLKKSLSPPIEARPYLFNSLSSVLLDPWKKGIKLLNERPDFLKFQVVFMLCGAGLMVIQPVLPILFKETLQLSYLQLTLATSLCKGVSFIASSSFWAGLMNRISMSRFNFYVCGFGFLYTLLVIGSQNYPVIIGAAYLIYGVMQAGSELSWHLSGPIFAEKQDSTLFTGVNVAAVGIRGCIAPFMGELMLLTTNSTTAVFVCGACFCLAGSCYSLWLSTQESSERELIQS